MTKTITATTGVDVFVSARLGDALPANVGAFTLKSVSSRGTVTSAKSAGEILDVGWVCARYLARDKGLAREAFDAELAKLLAEIGRGRDWSSVVKLYEVDGEKAYSGS